MCCGQRTSSRQRASSVQRIINEPAGRRDPNVRASSRWHPRQLIVRRLGMGVVGVRGKSVFQISPSEMTDHIEEWFVNGVCDCSMSCRSTSPRPCNIFVRWRDRNNSVMFYFARNTKIAHCAKILTCRALRAVTRILEILPDGSAISTQVNSGQRTHD
jgi:hypothetical protein